MLIYSAHIKYRYLREAVLQFCRQIEILLVIINLLKLVWAELSPRETLITWPILNRCPDFKAQQTYDAPDVFLALFLKKLTIPRQS